MSTTLTWHGEPIGETVTDLSLIIPRVDTTRTLICGDRNWTDAAYMTDVLHALFAEHGLPTAIIEGDARGADRLAGAYARSRLIALVEYPAKWAEQGKRAGPVRNQQMLEEGKPTLVVAFHRDLMSSKGTLDMVRRAAEAGVRVLHFDGSQYAPRTTVGVLPEPQPTPDDEFVVLTL